MKYSHKNLYFLACLLFFMASWQDANAQKKAKKSALAKQILGTWKLSDIGASLDESKATDKEKEEFKQTQAFLPMIKQMAIGKMDFTFNADGTYKTTEPNSTEEKTGKWTLNGDKLTLTKAEGDANIVTAKLDKKSLILEGPNKPGSNVNMKMVLNK